MADTWRDKVGRVFEEVRERSPEERATFLEERCEEEALRKEVASLLEVHEEATGLFSDLAAGAAASALGEWIEARSRDGGHPESEGSAADASDPLGLENERVGGYDVEEHLGGGGMGVVYRARDVRLGRPVALKFLPPHLAMHPEADERFVREARAAAALEHPHVATIHEIGQTENGRRYIAMAYYEGETLKQTIKRGGALPVEEAIRYAEQIAEALSAAHEAGIVHRDVKPANVMVTEDGTVKLLDFGLAQAAAETRLTETGRQPGTAAYMSPEQVRGEEVDPRTDLWALGALLYEILSGERPFEGTRRTAILHAVLHEEPPPVAERRPEIPGGLAKVVHRCLEKSSEKRYPSAEALRDDLGAVAAEEPLASNGAQPLPNTGRDRVPRRCVIGGISALLLAAIGAVGWALWPVGETEGGPTASTVAVLPFEVSGAGAETWRDGMVTTLSLNLDGAAGLRAIADRTVFAAWEKRGASAEGTSTETALAVARDVGAKYAIVGSAVQLGGELRLAAEVRRAATGRRLGQVDVQGPPESVTTLTDRLTRKVLGVLLEKSEDRVPSVNLASITTESFGAFKAFLDGERHLRNGELGAVEDFESAIRQDSTFALAHARIGLSGLWDHESQREHVRRARELSGRLPERARRLTEALYLGRIEHRTLKAAEQFRRLTEDYPDDPEVWNSLGEFLFHAAIPRGEPELEKAHERAVALDPENTSYYDHYVDPAFYYHRDSAMAARRVAAMPEGEWKQVREFSLNLVFGSEEERQRALASLDTLSIPEPWLIYGPLEGPTDRALMDTVLRRLETREDLNHPFYDIILVINGLHQGQMRQALADLDGRKLIPRWSAMILANAMTLDYPLPDSVLRRRLAPESLPADPAPRYLSASGFYLIERERTEALGQLADRLRSAVDTTGPRASSTGRVDAIIEEWRGYQALRTGDLQRAAQLLDRSNESYLTGAIWRGDLYRKLGDLEKAEGWYLAAWRHPVAHERLGRLYEKMGEPEKATAAYQRFVEAWKNADPELQGRVETARERLDALSSAAAAE